MPETDHDILMKVYNSLEGPDGIRDMLHESKDLAEAAMSQADKAVAAADMAEFVARQNTGRINKLITTNVIYTSLAAMIAGVIGWTR